MGGSVAHPIIILFFLLSYLVCLYCFVLFLFLVLFFTSVFNLYGVLFRVICMSHAQVMLKYGYMS